jgi:hypothetical protein
MRLGKSDSRLIISVCCGLGQSPTKARGTPRSKRRFPLFTS